MALSAQIRKPRQQRPFAAAQALISLLGLLATLVGLAAMLVEYGFYRLPGPLTPSAIHAIQASAAIVLLINRIVRLSLARDRVGYLRDHWLAALPILAAVGVAALRPGGLPAWLAGAQAYLLAAMLVRGLGLYFRGVSSGMHPTRLLVGSFLFLILIGAGLLQLPRSVPEGETLPFIEALFTSTSATCVTGLIVRDTGTGFTRFGQTIILCLIQLGGLGIMIFGTLFLLLTTRRLGVREAAAVGEMFSEQSMGRIGLLVRFVVVSTLLLEAAGAVLLAGLWSRTGQGWFPAVFHSISAFCNAGFSLQSDSFSSESMRNTWRVLLVVPGLIIVGGIGFPVLMDVLGTGPMKARYLVRFWRGTPGIRRPRWSLHTKVTLVTTFLLLVFGTAGMWLVDPTPTGRAPGDYSGSDAEAYERQDDWERMQTPERVRQSWFQAVSARTAGFNTVDLSELSVAGKLWTIMLMCIGGSPASTAGGMKTVTVAVLALLVWSVFKRRQQAEAFGRTFPEMLLRRAVTVAVLFMGMVGLTTLLLAYFQGPASRFIDVFFEAASACGTVGLSLGETVRLKLPGQCVIIGAMFAGRIGPLTLLMSLTGGTAAPARYRYPEENLVVG